MRLNVNFDYALEVNDERVPVQIQVSGTVIEDTIIEDDWSSQDVSYADQLIVEEVVSSHTGLDIKFDDLDTESKNEILNLGACFIEELHKDYKSYSGAKIIQGSGYNG